MNGKKAKALRRQCGVDRDNKPLDTSAFSPINNLWRSLGEFISNSENKPLLRYDTDHPRNTYKHAKKGKQP